MGRQALPRGNDLQILFITHVGHGALFLTVHIRRGKRVFATRHDVVGADGELAAPRCAPGEAKAEALLADVREAPISRKRGFSKSALRERLEAEGIGYLHLRELGCPKRIRDDYREDGDWARYTERFMTHLDLQGDAVDQLGIRAKASPTALLCFENDFNRCHRTYVARAVSARMAFDVIHITPAGLVHDPPQS